MTRGGLEDYLDAPQGRYLKGNRKEKEQTLDEVSKVTGSHRKAVIRLLNRRGNGKPVGWLGAVKAVWSRSAGRIEEGLGGRWPDVLKEIAALPARVGGGAGATRRTQRNWRVPGAAVPYERGHH